MVVYHSTRFNKDFRFKKCVPGGSTMIAGAFEYWCLDCDSLEKPGTLQFFHGVIKPPPLLRRPGDRFAPTVLTLSRLD